MFVSDPTIPSFESKCILLSHQVDSSHISGEVFCWPFAIASPLDWVSSSRSLPNSTLGHQSSDGHSTLSDPSFQLIVTINRRGRLQRNIVFVPPSSVMAVFFKLFVEFRLKQKVIFVSPPDPSTRTQISVNLPLDTATTTTPLWTPLKLPKVVVKGVMFGEVRVEVECKVSNTIQ